jgi:hypothetical protein
MDRLEAAAQTDKIHTHTCESQRNARREREREITIENPKN